MGICGRDDNQILSRRASVAALAGLGAEGATEGAAGGIETDARRKIRRIDREGKHIPIVRIGEKGGDIDISRGLSVGAGDIGDEVVRIGGRRWRIIWIDDDRGIVDADDCNGHRRRVEPARAIGNGVGNGRVLGCSHGEGLELIARIEGEIPA